MRRIQVIRRVTHMKRTMSLTHRVALVAPCVLPSESRAPLSPSSGRPIGGPPTCSVGNTGPDHCGTVCRSNRTGELPGGIRAQMHPLAQRLGGDWPTRVDPMFTVQPQRLGQTIAVNLCEVAPSRYVADRHIGLTAR